MVTNRKRPLAAISRSVHGHVSTHRGDGRGSQEVQIGIATSACSCWQPFLGFVPKPKEKLSDNHCFIQKMKLPNALRKAKNNQTIKQSPGEKANPGFRCHMMTRATGGVELAFVLVPQS